MDNIKQNLDDDGYISIDYYFRAADDIIRRVLCDRDIEKPDTNQINGCLYTVYDDLLKGNERKCNVAYCSENFRRLIEVYARLTRAWNALPSVEGFCIMSGISHDVLTQYVTDATQIIRNMRKGYIQNRLNNTPIGVMTLANNDIDTGLLYTRQNIVAHEAVKRSLSFEDLQRIAMNQKQPQHIEAGADHQDIEP